MVGVAILNLNDKNNWNRWIIGTLPPVEKNSPFYSEQLQISHIRNPDVKKLLSNEKTHYHKSPIEEFYFVMAGKLSLKIEGITITVKPMEILSVSPEINHGILDASADLDMLVFRTPITEDDLKISSK